jgi:serine/threonine-protein kinase
VLPFENLSTDKGNAYFADGMQDLILTKLADIGDLKVISRTSTMQYGSHPQNLKVIAQQLGVASILEGSVQKAGNQVLINVQLIDANTDSHVWAESYTRTLDNIFGVEGEVAQKVADALKAKLTAKETARIANVPTTNAAAYDLFLQGQYYETRALSSGLASDYDTAARSYQAAVEQDPKFALAWARLAFTQVFQLGPNGVARKDLAAQVKAAVDRSLALAPNLAEAHVAQGWYRDYVLHDLHGSLASFKAALSVQPQNADALFAIGVIHTHLGQMPAAIEYAQKATDLDPRNVFILDALAWVEMAAHHYAEAGKATERAIAIDPASELSVERHARVFVLVGDLDQAQSVLDAAPASVQDNSVILFLRSHMALYRRDYVAARQLLAKVKPDNEFHGVGVEEALGNLEWAAGDRTKAREHYLRAGALIETALKQTPDAARLHGDLGWIYSRLGRGHDALEQGKLAIKLSPIDKDALVAQQSLLRMTQIQVQLGQFDDALAGLDRLLAMPAGLYVSVPLLKLDPAWDPIRHDPRFQALLKKYAGATPSASGTLIEQGTRP